MRDIDPELLEKAMQLDIPIKGTWGNARIQQAIDAVEAMDKGVNVSPVVVDMINTTKAFDEAVDKFKTLEWASERASKIYAGQSPHLDIALRIGRIRAALKERGFTRWDELVIDGAHDYQRYL